jgi:hypothetical protein
MRTKYCKIINRTLPLLIIVLLLPATKIAAQEKIRFGVFADPVISWFSSDTKETQNDGSRAGFNFGLTFNSFFATNYAFSTGINILNAGGRLINNTTDTLIMKFNNFSDSVMPGKAVEYKVRYLTIPIGLKFKSNQIGYITFFTDIGIDPKFLIGGKADIPSQDIKGETATNELNTFNMSYHIMAGIEYSLGGSTSMVFGLGFENNFLDVTKELNNQPSDKIKMKMLKLRLGINF